MHPRCRGWRLTYNYTIRRYSFAPPNVTGYIEGIEERANDVSRLVLGDFRSEGSPYVVTQTWRSTCLSIHEHEWVRVLGISSLFDTDIKCSALTGIQWLVNSIPHVSDVQGPAPPRRTSIWRCRFVPSTRTPATEIHKKSNLLLCGYWVKSPTQTDTTALNDCGLEPYLEIFEPVSVSVSVESYVRQQREKKTFQLPATWPKHVPADGQFSSSSKTGTVSTPTPCTILFVSWKELCARSVHRWIGYETRGKWQGEISLSPLTWLLISLYRSSAFSLTH